MIKSQERVYDFDKIAQISDILELDLRYLCNGSYIDLSSSDSHGTSFVCNFCNEDEEDLKERRKDS